MKLVILVLNKVECLDELLKSFYTEGIKGATIFNSVGMARSLEAHDELRFLGSLRMLLDPSRKESKTIFVMTEKETVPKIKQIVDDVTGGLSKPDTGIMCTLDIDDIYGFKEN